MILLCVYVKLSFNFYFETVMQIKACFVKCLKAWDYVIAFGMFLSPVTTTSTSKFIYQKIFQIVKNMVFIWKIIFNFEWSEN